MSNYYGKIDVTKINKDYLFIANSGAKYLDIAIRENKDGPGKWGDTHMIIQNPSKETREADPNVRGPIIGNAKLALRSGQSAPQSNQAPSPQGGKPPKPLIDEDVPFAPITI